MHNITDYIDETEVFITANVVKAGINKTALYKYLKENNYEKIAHRQQDSIIYGGDVVMSLTPEQISKN